MTDLDGRRCLVLGAGGFIGTNLCRALAAQGARVQGFGRRLQYPKALDGIPQTIGDFADRTQLARIVEGQEIVFHLFGGPRIASETPFGVLADIVSSVNLLEICRISGVRKIIFVSSGGAIYGVPSVLPIPETAVTDPISAYGISKLAVEKYLHLYRHLYGLEYTALRLANPYGPFQSATRGQGVVPALLHRVLSGEAVEIWGTGGIIRDYIYIDDVTDALIAAIDYQGPCRVFNIGSGIGRSVLQIIEDIRLILGRRNIDRVFRPGRATDVPVNVLDIGLIRDHLGWMPRTEWFDGLRETSSWLQSSQPAA
ncbi:MAG: NAD-dependent epimerase/dehydratase family protein [Alphaproteobacteria bacterium]|nr:NAD-dependent epimerase/dehydratase family protein [Alphaproteobacteria bacterium]